MVPARPLAAEPLCHSVSILTRPITIILSLGLFFTPHLCFCVVTLFPLAYLLPPPEGRAYSHGCL